MHTAVRPFPCTVDGCGVETKTAPALARHLLTHTGARPRACLHSGCGKAFACANTLEVHVRCHTGERPYHCSHPGCGKAFATSAALAAHGRLHTGEKPFVCNVAGCAKAFRQQAHLATHRAIHTGERKYACEQCDYASAQSSNLKYHKEAQHTAAGAQRQKRREEHLSQALRAAGVLVGERDHYISFECLSGTFARVDFIVVKETHVVLLECDEAQHRHYTTGCDVRRMLDVAAAIRASGDERKLLWLRFSPDAFRVDGVLQKVLRRDRYAQLVRVIETYMPALPMEIAYHHYDTVDGLPAVLAEFDPAVRECVRNCVV